MIPIVAATARTLADNFAHCVGPFILAAINAGAELSASHEGGGRGATEGPHGEGPSGAVGPSAVQRYAANRRSLQCTTRNLTPRLASSAVCGPEGRKFESCWARQQ